MQLNKQTVEVLKNFSSLNSNLVIRSGSTISTITPSKDVYASFECDETFDEDMSIFNLNEFLGVLSAFDSPELELDKKFVTIKQNKQKVKYNYADESMLIIPPAKGIKFPSSDISFTLNEAILSKIQKMSAILSAEDLAVIGDGDKIVLKIFDKKNSACNEFVIDTDVDTDKEFQLNFKIEKLKLIPGNYTVEISKKMISKFKNEGLELYYFVAVEADSTF